MWHLGGFKLSKKSTFKFVPFCTGSVAFLATCGAPAKTRVVVLARNPIKAITEALMQMTWCPCISEIDDISACYALAPLTRKARLFHSLVLCTKALKYYHW